MVITMDDLERHILVCNSIEYREPDWVAGHKWGT